MSNHRKFSDTIVDEKGYLHAVDGPDTSSHSGPGEVKHRKFDDTIVDENGNLHAVDAGPGDSKKGDIKSRRKFADTVMDENGHLHAIPYPGFMEDK